MAIFLEEIAHICVLLIWVALWVTESKNVRYSMDDDLLLPYADTHGPSHSHRYVRDCQPHIHGNLTHETWLASADPASPVVESNTFVSAINSSWVSGHITVVHDPLRTVSVLEPGGPGGCKNFRRELVENTAKTRKCLIAQNGGYFVTKNGYCLGNIVSDGNLVQNSGGVQNAQFGIRKDGRLVFGYLSEDEVLDTVNPFVQLVSGVVWLLRSGEVYINESLKAECTESQETGTLQEFVNVISARTAVGHDAKGRLVLFHSDGQTQRRGMNLWEVAEFLKEQGVINAINLDGGGSATYVRNGSLASFPSDHCDDPMWRCPRAVSTVLCVHERLCQPEDCSQHGTCVDGQCVCQPGWAAPTCANLTCQPPDCGDHGLCTPDGCVCDAGWKGVNCSQECNLGFYGDWCKKKCMCVNGGSCDPVHGRCTCPAGFHGDSCEQECPLGYYGLLCSQECQCSDLCPCDPVTGSCNATFHGQRNTSLHRAGHCLATQMWKEWREQDEARAQKPYLSEQSWMVITAVLAAILLTSLTGNLIQVCGKCKGRLQQEYSYVPLEEVNRSGDSPNRLRIQPGKALFQPDDTDSEDSL
ncbi:N-acetylglucosamine-1-phosphodiester alpha-N-acetylglucosaminidase isoform X1 [Hemibagrus wyckioides]|uniref:N-acetylglucosamine-1-phosphodiester alpha-N-acetylglucosaminidase isoform X1 n=1 Tax=Hemibagrus wyckioides TaxID=337641 RepID=UPI00266BD64E|nr:N-acetylglucosamine-1-phosphodiester alpha-N-acetylglucosaminidase isoform X1 [Hemibagrus wyckioides]